MKPRIAVDCRHCGRRIMIVTRVTDAELIRLAAHFFARHAEHDDHAGWHGLRDVLRHFSSSRATEG